MWLPRPSPPLPPPHQPPLVHPSTHPFTTVRPAAPCGSLAHHHHYHHHTHHHPSTRPLTTHHRPPRRTVWLTRPWFPGGCPRSLADSAERDHGWARKVGPASSLVFSTKGISTAGVYIITLDRARRDRGLLEQVRAAPKWAGPATPRSPARKGDGGGWDVWLAEPCGHPALPSCAQALLLYLSRAALMADPGPGGVVALSFYLSFSRGCHCVRAAPLPPPSPGRGRFRDKH